MKIVTTLVNAIGTKLVATKTNRAQLLPNPYPCMHTNCTKREGKRDFANRQRVYEKHAINRCDLSTAVQCVYLPSGRATSWRIQEYVGEKCRTKCKTHAPKRLQLLLILLWFICKRHEYAGKDSGPLRASSHAQITTCVGIRVLERAGTVNERHETT